MPTKFVQHSAEKAGISVEAAEEKWHEAKKAVKKGKRRGHWYWGKVVNTFKKMMGFNEAMTFKEFALHEELADVPIAIHLLKILQRKGTPVNAVVYRINERTGKPQDTIYGEIVAWQMRQGALYLLIGEPSEEDEDEQGDAIGITIDERFFDQLELKQNGTRYELHAVADTRQ